MTQYDLIYDIVKSDYFINNVGNIFTEVGSVNKQNDVKEFLNANFINNNLRDSTLLELYRDISWPCWEKSNFFYFLQKLNSLNCNLQNELKVNLFFTDQNVPLRGEINSKEDFIKFEDRRNRIERDSFMAQNITTRFDSICKSNTLRKKSLVIMNARHAFSKPIQNEVIHSRDITNVGTILFEHYKGKTANVYLNSLAQTAVSIDTSKDAKYKDSEKTPIQNGKWDASFRLIKKESLGFDFRNSPFGIDSLDIWPYSKQYNYRDIFTGFAFYLPLEKHFEAYGIPNYLSNGFEEELYKRIKIFCEVYGGQVNKDELKEIFKYSESKYDKQEQFNNDINKWIK